MQTFIEGKRTWIAITMIAIGYFNIGDIVSSEQLGTGFDLIVQFVGLCLAIWGNYKSHQALGEARTKLGSLGYK